MIVTFCGHSMVANAKEVESWLLEVVEELIQKGATQFYLGGYGEFDGMAFGTVRKLKKSYPHIQAIYVLAYLDRVPYNVDLYDGTTYPPIEEGPPRLAILRRNKWMVEVAEVVVAYLRYENIGGAAAMYRYARGRKKQIVRFAETSQSGK